MTKPGMPRLIAALAVNLVVPPLIMGLAWGSLPGFFSHPARVAAAVLFLLPTLVMILFTAGYASHERRSDEGRGFLVALNIAANLSWFVAVFLEGHGIWVMPGGDVTRWTGVAILALGTYVRVGTMIELGRRFSLTVSAQAGHTLETTGFYRLARHPSYLGVVLISIGVAGAFRSWFWLALIPIMLFGLVSRMNTEERFMVEQFGDEYRAYMARTARLVPGVY
jgi:protein-S-isoprenylcysteine O-methyltransferase Ste14